MIIRGRARLVAVAAASVVAFATLAGQPAAAQQLYWDWGGDSVIGGSGRQLVSFNPKFGAGQIIVSFGDRKLYYVTQPGQAISYPIAVPREKSRWQGVTSVSQKRVNPSWTPTPTMLAENPRLPRWVPGGHPMNPLGVRALYLGSSMYRIHGTDAPWTIGTAASKGCIRLYNQDVLDLYPRVRVGAKVTVTYDRFSSGPAVASRGPSPKNGMVSAEPAGGTFFMLGDDEPPAKVVRKRPPRRAAKARSAAVTDGNDAAERSEAAGRSTAGGTSATGEATSPARDDQEN
jgi:lipoprotein-anchoring transpeptidase ErfK/SrfK